MGRDSGTMMYEKEVEGFSNDLWGTSTNKEKDVSITRRWRHTNGKHQPQDPFRL